MKYIPIKSMKILALDPGRVGVGFAFVQSDPVRLIDFGIKIARSSDPCLRMDKTMKLIGLYQPDAVILEDWRLSRPPRRDALKPFALALEEELLARDIDFFTYSGDHTRRLFRSVGAQTKVDVARLLATRFPELLWRVPPVRKIYLPEDYHMSLFDAVALGITHIDATEGARAP